LIWKTNPKSPHYEGEKKTKVAIFREEVPPTSGKIIGGNLNFFYKFLGHGR
jgi:muramoyltetrapeptide carboxypeptidase LdcA involved in peptidoglycan recycling